MATYSNNTTIKIGDVISYYRNLSGSSINESFTVPAGSYFVLYLVKRTSNIGVPSVSYQLPGQPSEVGISETIDLFEYYTSGVTKINGPNPFVLKFPSGTVFRMSINNYGNPAFSASYNVIGQLYSNTP